MNIDTIKIAAKETQTPCSSDTREILTPALAKERFGRPLGTGDIIISIWVREVKTLFNEFKCFEKIKNLLVVGVVTFFQFHAEDLLRSSIKSFEDVPRIRNLSALHTKQDIPVAQTQKKDPREMRSYLEPVDFVACPRDFGHISPSSRRVPLQAPLDSPPAPQIFGGAVAGVILKKMRSFNPSRSEFPHLASSEILPAGGSRPRPQ